MRRRAFAFAGGAAALAGAGIAIWRRRAADPAAMAPAAAAGDAAVAFWDLRFEALSGPPVVAARLRGRPLLVNFWATWCAPCVTEMPLLDRFHARQPADGWRVVAIAVDGVEAVRAFAAKGGLTLPIVFAEGASGIGLARRLGNTTGGLPFTVVFDRAGRLAHRKLGALAEDDLENWAGTRP